ncbi:Uncharacterised protein [Klebsiella aerogenes]|nr:Uncharacterised protein [Klebsiella aerogenes]
MHADVGGDCKPTELGKVQTDAASLLSKIVLHDMYAAAFDAGAPLSVPPEVLPGGAKEKTYRMMSLYVLEQFKISEQAIALFNACSRRRHPRKAKGSEKCRLSIRIGWTARRGAMTLPIPVSWRCWILFPPRKPAGKNDY